jgi:hypothetical protein
MNDNTHAGFRQGQPVPPLQGPAGIVKPALPMLAHRCRREFVVLGITRCSIKNSKEKSWTRERRVLIPLLQPDGGLSGATG